jgi:hypothetical protein
MLYALLSLAALLIVLAVLHVISERIAAVYLPSPEWRSLFCLDQPEPEAFTERGGEASSLVP